MIAVAQKPSPAIGSNLDERASNLRNQPHCIETAARLPRKANRQIGTQGANGKRLAVRRGGKRVRRRSTSRGKSQVKKIPPGVHLSGLEAIATGKSDAALEGYQLAQIDEVKPPVESLEFSAVRNRLAPLFKRAGGKSAFFGGNRRFRFIGLAHGQPALRFTRRILKLLRGERAAAGLRIITPRGKLPHFKMLLAHGSTSQPVRRTAVMTMAP